PARGGSGPRYGLAAVMGARVCGGPRPRHPLRPIVRMGTPEDRGQPRVGSHAPRAARRGDARRHVLGREHRDRADRWGNPDPGGRALGRHGNIADVTVRDSLIGSMAPVATGEILVVADDGMRKLVLHHVSILGLNSAQAESAAKALEIASEKAETLDCIVLDAAMVGVDVYDVSRKLHAEPETAVVPTLVILGRPPNEAEMLKLLEV